MVNQVKDVYTWNVIYVDGSIMCEYDHEEGRGFADVGNAPVKALDIEPWSQALPPHRILIPSGATPVFFRRRSVELNPESLESKARPTTHCIGWKRGDEAIYLFAFDDGSTLLTNDLQAV